MQSWEHTISRLLSAAGLDSIKAKVLAFAVLATLIPSLTIGRLSYVHNKQALTEKTNAELQSASSHTARETDLWLKERVYDVRVFSNSYEVSENLERILRGQDASAQDLAARGRLEEYLTSVRERFTDYDDLMVIDPQSRVVATSTGQLDTLHLPAGWLDQVVNDEQVLGDIYWDDALERPLITLAVPIVSATGRFLGVLAGKVNFLTIDRLIRSFDMGETGHVYLVADYRTIFASSVLPTTDLVETKLPATTVPALLQRESGSEYADYHGNTVVGTGELVPLVEWAVVAEVGTDEAYAPIASMRNQTLLMVSGLMLGIGLIAYLLGLTIVRPLDRLTNGAGNVAAGDLDVDLPVVGGGEVGYLTSVFNEMVARLRHGRQELERLAVTDDLTGLHNRKHLNRRLADEVARSDRYEHPFAIMMVDVDHFKNYNDTLGHPAGDEVLRRVGSVFKRALRDVDYCARYGGEEFFALLPQTPLAGAAGVAERVRATAEEELGGKGDNVPVTVSVGVAEYPKHGSTVERIVEAADRALYAAKEKGRNRVVRATVGKAKAARDTPVASNTSKTSRTPETSSTSKASDTPKTSSKRKTSSTSTTSDTPKTSSKRKTSTKKSSTPKTSGTPKKSAARKTSSAPKKKTKKRA